MQDVRLIQMLKCMDETKHKVYGYVILSAYFIVGWINIVINGFTYHNINVKHTVHRYLVPTRVEIINI